MTVQFQSYHPHLPFQCSSFLTPLIFCTADLPATALNCVIQIRADYLHYSIYHFIHKLFFTLSAHSTKKILWVLGTLSLTVKCLTNEAGHSCPPRVNSKNRCSYTPTPSYAFMSCIGTILPLP